MRKNSVNKSVYSKGFLAMIREILMWQWLQIFAGWQMNIQMTI